MLSLTETWKTTYPDAHIGFLVVRNAANPEHCEALDARKAQLEKALRERFGSAGREGIKQHPTIAAYNTYYKQFKKTYHVQHQVASIALKGRDIPRTAALVEAMFMAELNTLLLTAGHDLDSVTPPIRVGVASGTESYTSISGAEQTLKPDDMFIADSQGILSSIIYGPDRRTMIGPDTRNVLFTIYGPPGVPASLVHEQLEGIRDNVILVAPKTEIETLTVLSAAT